MSNQKLVQILEPVEEALKAEKLDDEHAIPGQQSEDEVIATNCRTFVIIISMILSLLVFVHYNSDYKNGDLVSKLVYILKTVVVFANNVLIGHSLYKKTVKNVYAMLFLLAIRQTIGLIVISGLD